MRYLHSYSCLTGPRYPYLEQDPVLRQIKEEKASVSTHCSLTRYFKLSTVIEALLQLCFSVFHRDTQTCWMLMWLSQTGTPKMHTELPELQSGFDCHPECHFGISLLRSACIKLLRFSLCILQISSVMMLLLAAFHMLSVQAEDWPHPRNILLLQRTSTKM